MAFKPVDLSKIATQIRGRAAATEPKIGISGSGQFMPNSLVAKAWEKVTQVVVLFDDDDNKLGLVGFTTEQKIPKAYEGSVLKLNRNAKSTSISLAGSGVLRDICNYNYKAWGNQSFAVEFKEMSKEKYPAYVITLPLPSVTPTPKPVVKREKKGTTTATVSKAQATLPGVEAPTDDELGLN